MLSVSLKEEASESLHYPQSEAAASEDDMLFKKTDVAVVKGPDSVEDMEIV